VTLHVVIGPPAGGKSTFVQANAAPGTPRWDMDEVASIIAATALNHDIPAPVMDVVLAMRRGLMGWLLDVETPVPEMWLINSSPSPPTIARLVQVGAVFHLVDPGIDECIARAQREGRPESTIQAIRAWYDAPPELPGEKGGDSVKHKNVTVQVKATGDEAEGEGTMVAYAAVFDNIDSYGDVIRRGAFTETLDEWAASGNTLPLLYGHDMHDPWSNIGAVVEAEEDDHGLKITAKFDLDNAKAAQVYKLVKDRRLTQMSFAYDVLEAAAAEIDGEPAFELRKLKLYEVSVVPIGANQETEILTVKAAEQIAERINLTSRQKNLLTALLKSGPAAAAPGTGGSTRTDPAPAGERPAEVDHPDTPPIGALKARLMLLERTPTHD